MPPFASTEIHGLCELNVWWMQLGIVHQRITPASPHEALDGARPSERWEPSPRPYPERIAPAEYPDHLEVRRVSTAGTFRLKATQPFLSHALANQ